MITHTQTLEPVSFVMESDPFDIVWQVTLNEDGSLSISSTGRRPGKVLILPCCHTGVVVTSEPIVRKGK